MALLKSGSTVGGNLIWHQGILSLFPAGESLYFKDYKIYTTNDKPSKADVGLSNVTNDAQVRKAGDTMTGDLRITTAGETRLRLKDVSFRSNPTDALIVSTPGQPIYLRPGGDNVSEHQVLIDVTGTVTLDRILVKGGQPGDNNSLTRKDYVDGKVIDLENKTTELANTKVAKAGDTMTGNLTAPVVLVSTGQNGAANALTRKDYVDGRVNEKVAKSGDTMTGNLYATRGVSVQSESATPGTGIYPGDGDGATWEKCNFDIKSWYGIGIRSDAQDGARTIVINARNGDITSKGTVSAYTRVLSPRVDTDVLYRQAGDVLMAGDGNINLKFPSGTHTSGFKDGYLLQQIVERLDRKMSIKEHLQKRNLNDIRTVGVYHQDSNANTTGMNYPEPNAGSLTVLDAAGTIQVYRVYNSGRQYQRAFYNTGPWTPWKRVFSYGDEALSVGFEGVSGLGNASIAIGDNDTGIKQNGDGNLELWCNNQRVSWMNSGSVNFDKNVFAPTFAALSGSVYTRGDGNCHYWFSNSAGAERGVIYSDPNSVINYRANGNRHVFLNPVKVQNQHNIPTVRSEAECSGDSGAMISGLVQRGGWNDWRSRGAGMLIETNEQGASNVWKAVQWGRDWIAGMDIYAAPDGVFQAQLHVGGANFQYNVHGDFTSHRDGNFNNVYIRSDERLKANFKLIDNATDKVKQLTGYIYDKKLSLDAQDYTETEAGIIAQTLQKVLPEAVTEKDGLLNVSSAGVNALLINAINELTARLEKLEGEK